MEAVKYEGGEMEEEQTTLKVKSAHKFCSQTFLIRRQITLKFCDDLTRVTNEKLI